MNNIKEFLLDTIPWVVNNYSNQSEMIDYLYSRLSNEYNYKVDYKKFIDVVDSSINDYKNNNSLIGSIVDKLYDDLEKTNNNNQNTERQSKKQEVKQENDNQKTEEQSKKQEVKQENDNQITEEQSQQEEIKPNNNKSHDRTIDTNTDVLEETLNNYQAIEEEQESNKIKTDGIIKDIFDSYDEELQKKTEEINEIIDKIAEATVNNMEEIEAIDESLAKNILDDEIKFSELVGIYGLYKKSGSKIQMVDANTFIKAGYKVVNDIVIIKSSDGVVYKYDIANSLLMDSNGNTLEVRYYLPSSYSDLSSLNTITCLSGQGEGSVYGTTGQNEFFLNDLSSDAILVMPKKKSVSGIDLNKASFSYMSEEIISGTKFAMVFSKQKQECKNTIIGCSNGGGSALKIASQSNGLYDTVVCVNYAAVFDNQSKGINGNDDNRLTFSNASNLDGLNLVFISTSSDPNLDNQKNSYLYNGIKKLLEICPSSDITFITNNNQKIYGEINNSNYHYYDKNSDFWLNNLNANYSSHGDYHKVFRDVINSGILA